MNVTEVIKFDKIKKEDETLKKELAEKDQYIKELSNSKFKIVVNIIECRNRIKELLEQQLFKEDFIVHKYCINCRAEEFPFDNKYRTCGLKRIINLKDNSKYDKLPIKDVKLE